LRGGGRLLSSAQAFLEGCKNNKTCYNSDMYHHDYNGVCMKRMRAFTLAEVLVTLGIIGVVSAMTVPSLMQNYQRQSYVTQLHKVYNELSQSLLSYVNEKNAINLVEAGITSQGAVNTFITSKFKIVQTCSGKITPCFPELTGYKKMNGTALTDGAFTSAANAYVLASGASIRPLYSVEGEKIMNIIVDINGQKGPNIVGRDMMMIFIDKNGLIDDYNRGVNAFPLTKAQRDTNYASCCGSANNTWGCFGKILNDNWEMTY